MPGNRYSTEQIAAKLREAERLHGRARTSRWGSLHAHSQIRALDHELARRVEATERSRFDLPRLRNLPGTSMINERSLDGRRAPQRGAV